MKSFYQRIHTPAERAVLKNATLSECAMYLSARGFERDEVSDILRECVLSGEIVSEWYAEYDLEMQERSWQLEDAHN